MSGTGTSDDHVPAPESSPHATDVQSAMQRLDHAVRGIRLRANAVDQLPDGDPVAGRIGLGARRAA